MPQATLSMLYVNPSTGKNETGAGQQASTPFKTLTYALQQAESGTVIQLDAGTYNGASGETFPLVIPTGVVVKGNESNKGSGVVITGSGEYVSPTAAKQNITIRMQTDAELRGVTVTNAADRGTAVWVESTAVTIANNTFKNSAREGIFATGTARPNIFENVFSGNASYGLAMEGNAKGEVKRNRFEKTGYGISVKNDTAPLLEENQILQNRSGVLISGDARPVLRKNVIEKNTDNGVTVTDKAVPDLGSANDPGANVIRDNGKYDLQNASANQIISAGNQLNPTKVTGDVEFVGNTGGSTGLTDIAGHWAEDFILGLVEKGFVKGFPDRTFKPNANLTRAEFAAIVAGFDLPMEAGTTFKDVSDTFWAKAAITKANRMGFLSGFPDGTFRPNNKLTRVEAIVALANGLQLAGGEASLLNLYSDRALIPSYATNPLIKATANKVVVNYPDLRQLQPMRDINRAEVTAMIYQALVAKGQATAINSEFIVQPGDSSGEVFSDVGNDYWAVGFINGLATNNLVSGFKDGSFKPDVQMTRAEYAALLAKVFNLPEVDAASEREFKDVSKSFWAYSAIQKAQKAGFLNGFPDNTFRPSANIERVQLIVSLVNGLKLSGGQTAGLSAYNDQSDIPEYGKQPVATATAKKIVVNYPDLKELNPTQAATRADVAAMVYQAKVNAGELNAITSPYIVTLTA